MKAINSLESQRIFRIDKLLPDQIINKYLDRELLEVKIPKHLHTQSFKVLPSLPKTHYQSILKFPIITQKLIPYQKHKILSSNLKSTRISNFYKTKLIKENMSLQQNMSGRHLFSLGCPICGVRQIAVKYYGEGHVCLNCRKRLVNNRKNKINVFRDPKGNIQGYEKVGNSVNFNVNINDIYIDGVRCYATFGDVRELVVVPYK